MSAFDWFLVAWLLLGMFLTIAWVGKPRTPLTAQTAAISSFITLTIIVGLLTSRGAL